MFKTSFQAVGRVILLALVVLVSTHADAQRVRLKQLERYLGDSTPIGPDREWYIGVTDTFGDQRYKRLDTLIAYIADSVDTDTDEQYIDSFFIRDDTLNISLIRDGQPNKIVDLKPYIDLGNDVQYIDTFFFLDDTLYISLVRDGVGLQKVYLGDLISLADQDKQQHDSAFIEDDILYLSLERDNINAHQIDLSPYLDDTDDQIFLHSGTNSYTNELSGSGGTNFTLLAGGGIELSHDGAGNVTINNAYSYYWNLNAFDDAYSSTTIILSNTVDFDGINGIRAMLSAPGSSIMQIDGSLLQHYVAATTGTPALIGDAGSTETVTFVGAGTSTTSISGNTVTVTSTEVDGSITNEGSLSVGAGTAATSLIQSNTSGSNTITLQEGGIVDISESGSTITISATEIDGSTSNELQSLTHTGSGQILTTLSLGGGSLNIVPGTGISMVRSGTASDGVLTITNTLSGDHDWYEVGTTTPPDAITDAMFHTGLTGIGMNPTYLLDVAADSRIYGHQIGRGGGSISTNFRAGLDALQSNTIGTSNIAIGPYALTANTINSQNIAIGEYALGANTAASNIGIGYNVLKNHVSGTINVAIGNLAMYSSTASYDNTAIGHGSMYFSTDGSYNTALGHESLHTNRSGDENVAIGDYAIRNDSAVFQSVALGRYALMDGYNGLGNIAIGYKAYAAQNNLISNYNTIIGYEALHGTTASGNSYNIGLGYRALYQFSGTGDNNIAIGSSAGAGMSGSDNVMIGGGNTVTGGVDDNVIIGNSQTATTAGNIIITNGAGTLGFKMLSSGLVGIGEATPTQKLHVPGNVRVTGAYYDSNNSPGTSGQVLSSTVTGTDWIDAAAGGTNLTFSGASSPYTLNSSTGTDVTFTAGSNITLSASSGNITISAAGSSGAGLTRTSGDNGYRVSAADGTYVGIEGGTGIDVSASGGSSYDMFIAVTGNLATLSSFGSNGIMTYSSGSILGRTITAGSGISVSNGDGVSGNPTISSTSGFNGVGAGTATSATITTNTTGGNAITIQGAGTISVTESTSSNGGTITLTGTGGTVTSVGLTGTTGIGVSGSPITTSGTFTLSLNNDLQAVENLATTGIVMRTGASTWTTAALNAISTGISSGSVVYINSSGYLDNDLNLLFNDVTDEFYTYRLKSNFAQFTAIPTYASEAAASGLATGTVYKTSTGELRIKL